MSNRTDTHAFSEHIVAEMMAACQNEPEWNKTRDRIMAAFGGYPDFWWRAIMSSGVCERTMKGWS